MNTSVTFLSSLRSTQGKNSNYSSVYYFLCRWCLMNKYWHIRTEFLKTVLAKQSSDKVGKIFLSLIHNSNNTFAVSGLAQVATNSYKATKKGKKKKKKFKNSKNITQNYQDPIQLISTDTCIYLRYMRNKNPKHSPDDQPVKNTHLDTVKIFIKPTEILLICWNSLASAGFYH